MRGRRTNSSGGQASRSCVTSKEPVPISSGPDRLDDIPVLAAVGLHKAFGRNVVVNDVSLELRRGSSLAIVGENGAGKSTVAKIIAGAQRPDSGYLAIGGEQVEFHNPRAALRSGVAYIPQELSYVPSLTAAENIVLGAWPSRLGLVSSSGILARARQVIETYGVELDLKRSMGDLTLVQRQLVEIVKALARESTVLILDEPTTSLSESEAAALFSTVRALRARGLAVLSILHRLDQIDEIADEVLVLRDGRTAIYEPARQVGRTRLVRAMLGREPDRLRTIDVSRGHLAEAAPIFEASCLTTDTDPGLRALSFSVSPGEILGVFGASGAGGEQLIPALTRASALANGEFRFESKSLRHLGSPRRLAKLGIAIVPPDRKTQGLILSQSIRSNLVVGVLAGSSRWGVLDRRVENRLANETIEKLDIRCQNAGQIVGELSGGNQQKVLLGSRLLQDPKLLILEQPTRGVDVGARAQIHSDLVELADAGLAIIVITNDVEEAVTVSNRMIVIRGGTVVRELAGADMDQEGALHAASG